MNVFSKLEPTQRRNLLVLFAVGLFFWASLSSLLPTLPSYVKELGGGDRQIGIFMGAFAIGLLLCRPQLGHLADRHSRKLVLLLGTVVAAIAPLGYLVVKSIPLLILIRAFHGISVAAFATTYIALVVDLSPVGLRGELIGYTILVVPIGTAIGSAIGGLLGAGNYYTALFLLAAFLGILSSFGSYQIGEPSKSDRGLLLDESTEPESNSSWQLVLSPSFRIPFIVLVVIGLTAAAWIIFLPLFLAQTKVNLNAGFFQMVAAIASCASRFFTGRASDRYGRGVFITVGLISYTLVMLILSVTNSAIASDAVLCAIAFLLAAILEGVGAGMVISTTIALISDRSSPQKRGLVFSLCISGLDLGLAIAGPVLGSLADPLGYRGIFALCTGLCFLALIVFITQSSIDLANSLNFALGRGTDVYAFDEGIN